MDKDEIEILADIEAGEIEKEIQETYSIRIGSKQMIKRCLIKFANSMKDEYIEPNDDLCVICGVIPVDIAQFDTCKGCDIA